MGFVLDWVPADLACGCCQRGAGPVCQDAGNVGSTLRSAAAFGFGGSPHSRARRRSGALKSAARWYGGSFGLALIEGLCAQDLHDGRVPLVVTSSYQGQWLHHFAKPRLRVGLWGKGRAWMRHSCNKPACPIANQWGRSLNVAAAGIICLPRQRHGSLNLSRFCH